MYDTIKCIDAEPFAYCIVFDYIQIINLHEYSRLFANLSNQFLIANVHAVDVAYTVHTSKPYRTVHTDEHTILHLILSFRNYMSIMIYVICRLSLLVHGVCLVHCMRECEFIYGNSDSDREKDTKILRLNWMTCGLNIQHHYAFYTSNIKQVFEKWRWHGNKKSSSSYILCKILISRKIRGDKLAANISPAEP